jgi:LysW-gamma-L-lysine carboxypeptidase
MDKTQTFYSFYKIQKNKSVLDRFFNGEKIAVKKYAVNLLTKMLEFYSPSGKERKIANFLFKKMEKLGYTVRLDSVGNIIGEIGAGSPIVMLCGHLDTVPGVIPVKRRKNVIIGRGAVDAKSALAAMIVAGSRFSKKNFIGKIIVIGVIDEEGKGRGIKNIIKEGLKADYAIFGEPSGVENVTVGYRGRVEVRITCKTTPGHAGAHWLYDNSLERAYALWFLIKNAVSKWVKAGSYFNSASACLTMLRGGHSPNVVPGVSKMTIDFRIPPQISCKNLIDEVKTVIQQFKVENPNVEIKMRTVDKIEAYEVDVNSKIVKALTTAISRTRKKDAKLLKKTGTGDMNVFGAKMKIPTVTYGPGSSRLEHTSNEYIKISEYLDSIKILQRALQEFFPIIRS